MPDITISLDEGLLRAGREYAERNHMALDELIRRLLADKVANRSAEWLEECFELADRLTVSSERKPWTRDELHERSGAC
ncbi:hypothetical protein HS125_20225 [bacterium]|nr:hypothetical protein [bacterium]